MKFFDLFLRNTAISALVGVLFGMFFFGIISGGLPEQIKNYVIESMTILATLLAAGLALAGVFSTNAHQRELEEQRRQAALFAAKATLPLALSRFTDLSERGISFSLEDDSFYRDPIKDSEVSAALEIGDETLSILRDCIQYSDRQTQRWISALLAHYQIAHSELIFRKRTKDSTLRDVDKHYGAFEWAVVGAISRHLFDYARSPQERSPGNISPSRILIPGAIKGFVPEFHLQAKQNIARWRRKFGNGSVENFELDARSQLARARRNQSFDDHQS